MIEIPDEHLMQVAEDATGWKNYNRRMKPPRTWHAETAEAVQALVEIRALLNSVPGLKCNWFDYPEPLYAFVPTLEVVNFLIKDRENAWEWARKFKERLDAIEAPQGGVSVRYGYEGSPPKEPAPQQPERQEPTVSDGCGICGGTNGNHTETCGSGMVE